MTLDTGADNALHNRNEGFQTSLSVLLLIFYVDMLIDFFLRRGRFIPGRRAKRMQNNAASVQCLHSGFATRRIEIILLLLANSFVNAHLTDSIRWLKRVTLS